MHVHIEMLHLVVNLHMYGHDHGRIVMDHGHAYNTMHMHIIHMHMMGMHSDGS